MINITEKVERQIFLIVPEKFHRKKNKGEYSSVK
jgi:hypothetical protein